MNATISGCSAHQSESALVHSRARRTSYTSWHARMTPQYTIPVTIGESSSAVMVDHRLVEQGETFPHASVLDQHVALSVDREREEVSVTEALADANGLACGFGGRGEVARRLVLEHRRQEQVAALGTLALVLKEPLCTAQPARRRADLAAGREVQADPHRAVDGAQIVCPLSRYR